jgi:HPt (histidine-containing phosphotransfer) domain-containing protein
VPRDPDDALAQQLGQLRREYLRDSHQRVEELLQLRAGLAGAQSTALADLRQAFHRLAGSGGSYGFPEVSARSREGEQLMVQLQAAGRELGPLDVAAVDRCIGGVADAFAAATRSFNQGGGAGS